MCEFIKSKVISNVYMKIIEKFSSKTVKNLVVIAVADDFPSYTTSWQVLDETQVIFPICWNRFKIQFCFLEQYKNFLLSSFFYRFDVVSFKELFKTISAVAS